MPAPVKRDTVKATNPAPAKRRRGGQVGNENAKGHGAPKGNNNAIRHGLVSGKLPKGCGYIERRIDEFRRKLEALVLAAKDEVSVTDAATINSACKWERHGMLAQRWLRVQGNELSAADKLRFSAEIAKASDNRDKNIRLLQLDKPPEPIWGEVVDA